MTKHNYHIPVLLHDVIQGLSIQSNGVYVDVTFGGGGHSRSILEALGPEGKLIGFDQDADAQANVLQDERFKFVPQNFSYLKPSLKLLGISGVDGILADLGVSSHQFDTESRGFSTRFESALDMRMNQRMGSSAADLLNSYPFEELAHLFRNYGELKQPGKAAQAILTWREAETFSSTNQLKEALKHLAPKGKEHQFYAKVFQAIRIEVNDEMGVLKNMLQQACDMLKPGGKLVVISYHSLEDRLVKNFIKKGKFDGELEKDFYGNVIRPLKEVNRKVIVPTNEEIAENNRARSAKLRIAEKL